MSSRTAKNIYKIQTKINTTQDIKNAIFHDHLQTKTRAETEQVEAAVLEAYQDV